jgi:uncharacterized protein
MSQNRSGSNRAAIAALVIFSALGGTFNPGLASGDPLFKRASLKIETGSGPVLLDVEVAATEPERAHGLMFRRNLAAKQGMIFLFDETREITMWMKNTYISLDMVFIGEDWRIVHIATDAEPLSTDVISSVNPAARVLEIGGGEAQKLGLKVGDKLTLRQ